MRSWKPSPGDGAEQNSSGPCKTWRPIKLWPRLRGTCKACISLEVCLAGVVWPVGGPAQRFRNVPFPPLRLRPWSGHFYARDSFMKHQTWSSTWHEIGHKAEPKKSPFSGRMWGQYGWLDLEADASSEYCPGDWKDMTPEVKKTTQGPSRTKRGGKPRWNHWINHALKRKGGKC